MERVSNVTFLVLLWFICFPVFLGSLLGSVIAKRFGTNKTSWFLGAFQALYLHQGAILAPTTNIHAFGPDGANNEIWAQVVIVWPLMFIGALVSFWVSNRRNAPWKTHLPQNRMASK
jgi:uncharacterized membrane protein YfcA